MGISMILKIQRLLTLCLAALLATASALSAAKTVSLYKFRIQKQISGWTEEKSSYQAFGPKELFTIIDGGAPEYIDNGLKKGFLQRISGPDSAAIELYAEDFKSEGNAQKMFSAKQAASSGQLSTIPPDTAKVLVNEVIGGVWMCAAMGQYYFELTLTGVRNTASGKTKIGTILDYIGKTAKGLPLK